MGIGVDLGGLDASGQADLVRRRELTALELVDAAIANVERLDGELNAVVHRRFERARAEAKTPNDGAFVGVPFLVKDLIAHSEADPFHEGIRGVARQGYRARADTALIRRFRGAGLICLGRTNTPELGLVPTTEPVLYGPTRNPWDIPVRPVAPAVDRRRQSRPGWSRSRTATTVGARSAFRLRVAGSWG